MRAGLLGRSPGRVARVLAAVDGGGRIVNVYDATQARIGLTAEQAIERDPDAHGNGGALAEHLTGLRLIAA